jgi:hypothetical protein
MHAEVGVDQGGYRSLLGTITLPAGTITVDPIHHIIGASAPNGVIWATDTSPQLYGNGGTYSTQLGGWLPVPPELVAPDGLHYAYGHVDGTIRLGNSGGQEGIIANPLKLTPLAFTSSGVVLTGSDVASNGLWMLDTTTHAITPITPAAGTDDWREVVNGVAWGVDSPGVLGYPAPTKLLTVSVQPARRRSRTAPAGDSIALIAVDRQGGVMVDLRARRRGSSTPPSGGGVSPVTAAVA